MAKLVKSFETQTQKGVEVLEVTAKANSRQEAADLDYTDFSIKYYINNRLIANLTDVLYATPVFEKLIDSCNWEEIYCEQKETVDA